MIYRSIHTVKSTHTLKKYATVGAIALGATLTANSSAFAGSKVFAFSGSTLTLNGSTETNQNANVDPFVIETFSSGNECLRIAVTSQGTDLEGTLVAPDGRSWRDDDSNGALRPLIKAITTTRGWYILRLSHFAGASVNADFTVQISRLGSSNASCSPPTPPSTTFAPVRPKAGPAPAPLPGGTTSK